MPKLEEMRDILDIKGMPIWNLGWVAALLLILLGVLVAWWLIYFYKKRKSKSSLQEPPKSPMEIALDRITDLIQRGLIEAGHIRPFYFSLSEIFREFLEKELKIPATETTLEELRPILKNCHKFTTEELKEATWLLQLSDLAKFARETPKEAEIVQSVKTCRLLITSLGQRQEVVSQESPAGLPGKTPLKGAGI